MRKLARGVVREIVRKRELVKGIVRVRAILEVTVRSMETAQYLVLLALAHAHQQQNALQSIGWGDVVQKVMMEMIMVTTMVVVMVVMMLIVMVIAMMMVITIDNGDGDR